MQNAEKKLTLSPLKFEDALAAALETPPEWKPKKKGDTNALKK
jgi:hypothetical protein